MAEETCVLGHPLAKGRGRWFILHDGNKFIKVHGTTEHQFRDGPYCAPCIVGVLAEKNNPVARGEAGSLSDAEITALSPELVAQHYYVKGLLRENGAVVNDEDEFDTDELSSSLSYISPIGVFRLTLERVV